MSHLEQISRDIEEENCSFLQVELTGYGVFTAEINGMSDTQTPLPPPSN